MRHRIGLIADVQYANIDDAWNFAHTCKRRYRSTLMSLRNAVNHWKNVSQKVDLIVDLGDVIDGFKNENKEMGIYAISQVMQEWSQVPSHIPLVHLVGNHELYKFNRNELRNGVANTNFTCCSPTILHDVVDLKNSFYYSFLLDSTNSPWRVIILDPYEVSVMSEGGGRVNIELTLENGGLNKDSFMLCQRNNPNDLLSGGDYFKGLQGLQARWAPFNGALGKEQLTWLQRQLMQCSTQNEKVIVFSHVIIHPDATPGKDCQTLLWNYEEVLSMFQKFPCVRMVIAGHAHHEGYCFCPETKIHHISLASPLEAPGQLSEETFATLEISDDDNQAKLIGSGWVRSMNLALY